MIAVGQVLPLTFSFAGPPSYLFASRIPWRHAVCVQRYRSHTTINIPCIKGSWLVYDYKPAIVMFLPMNRSRQQTLIFNEHPSLTVHID